MSVAYCSLSRVKDRPTRVFVFLNSLLVFGMCACLFIAPKVQGWTPPATAAVNIARDLLIDCFFAMWATSALGLIYSFYQPKWVHSFFVENFRHFVAVLLVVFLATVIFIDVPTWFGFSWSFMPQTTSQKPSRYADPINIPTIKTSTPPTTTWNVAESTGVSM